jgi:hypothetical protein
MLVEIARRQKWWMRRVNFFNIFLFNKALEEDSSNEIQTSAGNEKISKILCRKWWMRQ